MKTKTRPGSSVNVEWSYFRDWGGSENHAYTTLVNDDDTITYETGPKVHGLWPWKSCHHTCGLSMSLGGAVSWSARYREKTKGGFYHIRPAGRNSLPPLPVVTDEMRDEAISGCLDQIDLNTSDAVLLYSGVLQAVPLLGSVTKFNQIMRNVSDHISKRLRKKPFTTVIKDLISADFIDRFVISPTLADIRKFQDATDYTLRVIESARARNDQYFALNRQVKRTVYESESTWNYGGDGAQDGEAYAVLRVNSHVTCKAFTLLKATYDLNAVSPLKVWAQRVGLTRPLDSVWDLVPFSFVVDYFTRAGDFISHLSDEMSSIDGLKGNITDIRDLWISCGASSEAQHVPTGGWRWLPDPWPGSLETLTQDQTPAVTKRFSFERYPVPDQWSVVNRLMSRPEDYLSVNLDLSQTRKRTLAELVIQAKL